MKVFVNIKKAGSRKLVLSKKEYNLPFREETLEAILAFFVQDEVEKYNNRNQSEALIYLTEKDIVEQATQGKVSFQQSVTDRKVDLYKAIENAKECYRDGLVRVFLNDKELERLEDHIEINENDVFTFVRLTFLTGRSY